MTRYSVDYEGWICVDADNPEEAMQKASDILSKALPYQFHGGDWELTNTEEDEDES
jgi:hypothetical protein